MAPKKTSRMRKADVACFICSATAFLLSLGFFLFKASWPALWETYTSQLAYEEAPTDTTTEEGSMDTSPVASLDRGCPDCPLPCPKTPPLSRKNWSTPLSLTEPPPTSCCLECDIAELRIGKTHSLHGCPELDYGLHPTVLEDLFRVGGRKPIGIANLGDSLLRTPFTSFPATVMGSRFQAKPRGFNMSWFRDDQVFCCKDRFDTSTCMYGREKIEFEESGHQFVQKFLASSAAGFCESFTFKGVVSDLQPVLKVYMDCPLPPIMVLMNPGMHHLQRRISADKYEGALQGLFENIVAWQREKLQAAPASVRTRFLFYSTTMVNDTLTQHHKAPVFNRDVLLYNEVTSNIVSQMRRDLSEASIQVIDGYRLTSLGHMTRSPDGLHYGENFNDIANLIKINFLMHPEFSGFCSSRFS